MIIHHFFTPGLAINSYLVVDDTTKRGVVIDPTRQIDVYLARAKEEGVKITDIVETHVHADFISGAPELKAALENQPIIHCSGMGGKEWTPLYADEVIHDRDEISLGTVRLQAWHTPGHTPEHLIWLAFDEKKSNIVPQIAFTGDLLFVGSIGRPDLLGHETEKVLAKQLYRTLFHTLSDLPEFVKVYPAHGAGSLCGKGIGPELSSTWGYERESNPGLIPLEYDSWLKQLHEQMPSAPRYFSKMKQINITGPAITRNTEMPLELTSQQIKEHLSSCLFLDTRSPEAFSAGHIQGAVNVPLAPAFSVWVGATIPEGQQLIIVVDKPSVLFQVVQALKLIGFDDVFGFVNASDLPKEMLVSSPMIDAKTLRADIEKYYIIDVRTPLEWDQGHISSAHHIELTKVPEALETIPLDKPIAVICHSGNRASIVASLIERGNGKAKVYNVRGGMTAWNKAETTI